MIVPMKKVTILCLDADQVQALTILQDMGVIHVEHLQDPEGHDVSSCRARREAMSTAQTILGGWFDPKMAPASVLPPDQLMDKAERARRLDIELRELKVQIEATQAEAAKWAPFGHFDLQQVQSLAQKGIRVRLFFLPGKRTPHFPDSVHARILDQNADGFFVSLTALDDIQVEGIEYPLPSQSLTELESHLATLKTRLTDIETELRDLARFYSQLETHLLALDDELLFEETRAGMKSEGRISCLRGYCPIDALPGLIRAAQEKGWGILSEDPTEEDPVPTLVRNPAWIRPIRFLFELIGVIPGYNEVDISAAFLAFYSLFFAMLVGDAGYGALFLAITMLIKFKVKAAPKDLIRLLSILSIGTIIWGVLTGSYFGIVNIPAPLAGMRVKWLGNEANVMQLCFLIGSIHLTLAHLWNLIRSIRQPVLLAQLGWIGMTWTMYFMAGNMILDKALPGFIGPLFLVSLVLIILFMTPMKTMKTEWYNHIMLPLSIIGAFGDVVSYVRLFAVGSAGTAISMAFNQMAVGDGIHSIGAGLTAALILFLAHTLNIMLCALGVIVHGVRLNTLEFSGHLGMQWTGRRYAPLARNSSTKPASGSVPS